MLSTVLLLVGCDLSDPFKNNNNDSGKDRIICPVIFTTEEEVVSDASNDFAFRFFEAVDSTMPKGANYVVSPYSAQVALAMAMNGADGSTFEQMRNVLGYKGMDIDDIFNQDFKTYKASDDTSIGISQVMTMDLEEIENNKDKYIEIMNNMHNMYGYKAAVMFVTDAIKNGSYIYYNDAAADIVAESFDIKDIYQGVYIDGLVSRKKQMLPPLLECVERKN